MVRHKEVYFKHFGIDPDDPTQYIPCERCTAPAVDIHHLTPRGRGGDPTGVKDVIENLAALCRRCHNLVEAVPEENEKLRERHLRRLKANF